MGQKLKTAPIEAADQEVKWDESVESAKEFLESGELLLDEDGDSAEEPEITLSPAMEKSQFTALRRRIEDRLDSKRLMHEFEFDDL